MCLQQQVSPLESSCCRRRYHQVLLLMLMLMLPWLLWLESLAMLTKPKRIVPQVKTTSWISCVALVILKT
jgi:hypothetical protein